MAFNAGRVEVHLGAQLDRREFELYERKLKEIKSQVAKKEQFKAELGGDFNPRAFNAYQRELKATERQSNEAIRTQGRLRTSFGAVYGKGGAIFAAAGGIAALGVGLKSVIQASGEAEVSQRKMAAALKAVGINYQDHQKQIDKVIQSTSKLAGLDDEDLQDAFTAIVRSTKSVNTGLKDMALVADLARAKHMDVAAAGQLVARVHAGNVRVLKSLGIEFVASTKHVDELKASHKKYTPEALAAAKAQDKHSDSTRALGLLQDRLKGTAKAYGETQQGAMDRVKVSFENLRETIGKHLAPTITRAADALAKFITQMDEGTGSGGDFVRVLKSVYGVFKTGVDLTKKATAGWAGFFETIYRGIGQIARFIGMLHPGNDAMDRLATRLDTAADKLQKFRDGLKKPKKPADDLRDSIHRGNVTLGNLNHYTDTIKFGPLQKRLGNLGGSFDELHSNVVKNINHSVHTVVGGMSSIQRALNVELKNLGVSGDLKPAGGLQITGGIGQPLTKAGGGWIGQRGMVGQDTVPAMLAPGEAVLNRHQQRLIETLLGDGFLDQLFERVNTPHYFAKGGRSFAQGGVNQAVSSLANTLVSKFGLAHGSTTGGTHAPNSYHYRGMAEDLTGSQQALYGASQWIKTSGTYRSLLEGIHNPNLAVKDGRIFSGAGPFGSVWGNHLTHLHIALSKLGAAASGGIAGIQIPKLVGGRGALGMIARAALQQGGKAANSYLSRIAGSLGGGDLSSAGVSGGGSNQALAQSMAAGRGWTGASWNALRSLWQKESGFSTTATNPRGGNPATSAYGIPQALPGSKMASAGSDWIANPSTQIKWGLGYIAGRYGGPAAAWAHSQRYNWYGRGGLVQNFASGGRVSKRKKPRVTASDTARDYIRPLRALQTDRIEAYDADMTAVDDLNTAYSIRERTYDLSDEELIRDDGSVDEAAVKKRADELAGLASVRARIVDRIRDAIKVVRRVIHTYNTILKRLRASLAHAKKKDRAGVKGLISTYEGRLGEWHGVLKDLRGDKLPNAVLDMRELQKERRGVLGTTAETQDTGGDTGGDLGGGDTTSDTGAGDTTSADTGAQVSQYLQQLSTTVAGARINAATLATFASPGDIGTGGSNALTAAGGSVSSAAPIAGAIDAAAAQGVTIVQNINTLHPGDPEVLRALADAATSGIGLQASRSVSVQTLGI